MILYSHINPEIFKKYLIKFLKYRKLEDHIKIKHQQIITFNRCFDLYKKSPDWYDYIHINVKKDGSNGHIMVISVNIYNIITYVYLKDNLIPVFF